MGVSEGKLSRSADLRRFAIESAITEINQLSRINLNATPRKIGRTVASVEISREPKHYPTEVKRELDRPRVSREARLSGTAEEQPLAFPASGGVKYTPPWNPICKENCNWNQTVIADRCRAFLNTRNIKLDAQNIQKLFGTFCKNLPNM